jgi:hypothetical protein
MPLFMAKNMEAESATFVKAVGHIPEHTDHDPKKPWDFLRMNLCEKGKLLAMICSMPCGKAREKRRKREKTFIRG